MANLANHLRFAKLKPSKVVVTINNYLADLFIRQTFFSKTLEKSKFAKHFPRQTFPLYSTCLCQDQRLHQEECSVDLHIIVANAIVTIICVPGIMSGILFKFKNNLSLYYWYCIVLLSVDTISAFYYQWCITTELQHE